MGCVLGQHDGGVSLVLRLMEARGNGFHRQAFFGALPLQRLHSEASHLPHDSPWTLHRDYCPVSAK